MQSIGQSDDALADANGSGLDLGGPARRLAEFAGRESIEVLDLGPPLWAYRERTGQRFYWKYDAHWNEAGHEVVARALFEYLSPALGLPARD